MEGQTGPFVIETDHQLNTYVDQSTNQHTLKRRARWLYESAAFNYVWNYRPGTFNVADPLSRAPQHFAVTRSAGHCVRTLDSVTAHAQLAAVALLFGVSVRGAREVLSDRLIGKQLNQYSLLLRQLRALTACSVDGSEEMQRTDNVLLS